MADLNEWISKVNKDLSERGMPHIQRPFEALTRYSKEFRASIALDSAVAQEIFRWFKENSKPGVHAVGPKYRSAYYFDSEFWEFDIPIFYGKVNFVPINHLRGMPNHVKDLVEDDENAYTRYIVHWANCFDYTYGLDVILHKERSAGADAQLLKAGEEELKSANALLLEHRPNARAMMNCRMAIEIHLKWILASEFSFSERDLKRISHDILAAAQEVGRRAETQFFSDFERCSAIFSSISARYKSHGEVSRESAWEALYFSHDVAAWAVRRRSPYNFRADLESKVGGQS